MFLKALAVVALVTLPLIVVQWHRSHKEPVHYRWDLTVYKSMDLYLKDGVCGMHVLSMPTRVGSRTEHASRINYNASPNGSSLYLSSNATGRYRHTWLVFPFWLPALLLACCGILPVMQGPVRRWWRAMKGRCIYCAYDLRGSHGKCPECGWRY
jgi:hypothetical protein